MKLVGLILTFLFVSCVGTVEEGKPLKSTTISVNESRVSFKGVEEVIGIADDKIEIYFKPAKGGSELYDYYIYAGGGGVPTVVPSEVLAPDYRGLLKYTLTGLEPGTIYKIKVDVRDQEDDAETLTDTIRETETFINDVCDFSGIGSIKNLPGVDGVDSIEIYWPHAVTNSDGLLQNPGSDPKQYEISIISAALYSPADFDNVSLNGGLGRFYEYVTYNELVSSVVVRGLPSSQKFYVRVRCIHKDTKEDISKPWLKWEMNNDYLEISTLSNDLASINFDPEEVEIIPGVGIESSSTFTLSLGDVSGVFDHYRVYYSEGSVVVTDTCKINEIQSGTYCKKASYKENSVIVHPLTPDTNYNVWFVICQTQECKSNERIIAKTMTYNTFPQVAPFLGLENMEFSSKIEDLGTVQLTFTPPNLTQGYFDGFAVFYKDAPDGAEEDITDLSTYSGSMYVDDYNPETAASLRIVNVPYYQVGCFSVGVFIFDGDGERVVYPTGTWICKTPVVLTPDSDQFLGFNDVSYVANSLNTSLSMSWIKPIKGVYSEYEVFVRHDGGQFSFSEAITETSAGIYTHYWKYVLPSDYSSFTIPFLTSGTYRIGVLTHHADYTGSYRSEFNDAVYRCVIPVAPGDGSSILGSCTL